MGTDAIINSIMWVLLRPMLQYVFHLPPNTRHVDLTLTSLPNSKPSQNLYTATVGKQLALMLPIGQETQGTGMMAQEHIYPNP